MRWNLRTEFKGSSGTREGLTEKDHKGLHILVEESTLQVDEKPKQTFQHGNEHNTADC